VVGADDDAGCVDRPGTTAGGDAVPLTAGDEA
jgi:hypothetical protein